MSKLRSETSILLYDYVCAAYVEAGRVDPTCSPTVAFQMLVSHAWCAYSQMMADLPGGREEGRGALATVLVCACDTEEQAHVLVAALWQSKARLDAKREEEAARG